MEGTSMDVVPFESGSTAVSNFNQNVSWKNVANAANPTFVFIAVECVKDENEFKFGSDINFRDGGDFEHVSPLDPNMGSTARYSPTYVESDIAYTNSVVVQQLISTNSEDRQLMIQNRDSLVPNLTGNNFDGLENSLNTADANLFKQVISNRYLLNRPANEDSEANVLHLVPDPNTEEEVQLMITDQTTGVSYNVSTQEYLVERCLSDEQQLLDSLEPDSLLNSADLLTLDDSTLKSQLSDIADASNCNISDVLIKIEECDEIKSDNNMMGLQNSVPDVRIIADQPVKSRARASLPTSHLAIVEKDKECGVFARKLIPKKTRFGPMEGVLTTANDVKNDSNGLKLLLDVEDGITHRLVVSDENAANWMRFVRRAENYMEQNLLLSQHNNGLYFTATVNIHPKQELLVGYGAEYARKHQLVFYSPIKEPLPPLNNFITTKCDDKKVSLEKEEKILKLKDDQAKSDKKFDTIVLECKICNGVISCSDVELLTKHLTSHGIVSPTSLEDNFTIVDFVCNKCEESFATEALLKVHNQRHKVNISETKNKNRRSDKSWEDKGSKNWEVKGGGHKCPVCYKVFASLERIQKHTLVHGSEESKPLKCDTCAKRFLNNSALACHVKTHNKDKKMFECPMCKESFDHVVHLKGHASKHRQDGKYICPHCDKIFKEYSVIRKHIRAFHCDRKHNCPHCGKPFPTLDKLRMHSLRHSDHREFLCADCGKQFKRKDKLKEHAKRVHADERENTMPKHAKINVRNNNNNKKFMPKVQPTDYHRFIYKCHSCLVGFKRRGMLVNHLAKRHPDISLDSVPELNLPILRTTRDYYCQYCDKVYKSSSKRKAHILKNHPGQALPMSNRKRGSLPEVSGLPNPTFSQTVGSITTRPQACQWCHKQYASKAKLLQHQRKKHSNFLQSQSRSNENAKQGNEINPSVSQEKMQEIVVDSRSVKRDFQMTDDFLAEVITLSGDEQYYRIMSVPSSNSIINLNQTSDLNRAPDSRLYHLLTTGSGLLPPSR